MAGRGSCEERLQKIPSNWFGSILHCIKIQKKVVSFLMTGFIQLHCSLPTNPPTSVKTYILSLGVQNILIEKYTSLNPELNHQVREIRIRLRGGRRRIDTSCLKSHLMKRKVRELKKDAHYSYVSFVVHTSSI